MKFEKLPNGKWKPIKESKTPFDKNGKRQYEWDDPIYIKKVKNALEKIVDNCTSCGVYTLANPCIHHLPDGYKNDNRRKAYYKKVKEQNSVEVSQNSVQDSFNVN
jgi:hypothetical protein